MIKIGFVDTFDPAPEFFMEWLGEAFDVARDDVNPQVLFFGDENFGTRNLKYTDPKIVRVFYTGENRRPQNYRCHYSVTFDHSTDFRNFRLPLWVLNLWHYRKMGLIDVNPRAPYFIKGTSQKPAEELDFASFVVSNPGCPERNNFFHLLNTYKKVSSAGPLFNNTGFVLPRNEKGVLEKIKFVSEHKFALCFENSAYPGYTSEKIVEGFLGMSVPIYWGSPTVALDFNPKAFINCHDYASFEDVLSRVEELDRDFALYDEMLCEGQDFLNDRNAEHNYKTRFQNWFERQILCHIEDSKS